MFEEESTKISMEPIRWNQFVGINSLEPLMESSVDKCPPLKASKRKEETIFMTQLPEVRDAVAKLS